MEFLNLGKHCDYKFCKQLDFLPFHCNHCKGNFCLEHRKAEFHTPTCKAREESLIVICDKCNENLGKIGRKEDEVKILAKHNKQGCLKISSKPAPLLCSMKGCRNKIIVTLECKSCKAIHCIKHRFPENHKCGIRLSLSPPITTEC